MPSILGGSRRPGSSHARYLRGLHDGGWRGNNDEVRRAIALTGAARYAWLAPEMLLAAARGDAREGSPIYERPRYASAGAGYST